MKKNIFFIIIVLLLISCSSSSEDVVDSNEVIVTDEDLAHEEGDQNGRIENFISIIRPGKTDWKLDETYTDTLEFIMFDDNYDYWYAVFNTSEGKEVAIA